MRIYRVGGSVRDELLGLPVADRDWVVVGATPDDMIAQGFLPVGKDFPVFLHPQTREEYALARTERKTGPGYKGFAVHFAPGVTLEEDLARRDLTINAMARAEDGRLIDPFGGERDLHARVLRHVGPAFAEDPVRILRVARFAARFADFTVAPETMQLMRAMTAGGEVDALVAERVWQEISRGLMARRPSRMIEVLRTADALAVLLPELATPPAATPAATLPQWPATLDRAADRGEPLAVRFALLCTPATAGTDRDAVVDRIARIGERLRAPNECRDAAGRFAAERIDHRWLPARADAPAADLYALLMRCDGWRRPLRVDHLLRGAAVLAGDSPAGAAADARIRHALAVSSALDQGAIARRHAGDPAAIRDAIEQARVAAIAAAVEQPSSG
ncbi:MAG: CCA tRNA nucleotidyltransferase [Lautropia sp.]